MSALRCVRLGVLSVLFLMIVAGCQRPQDRLGEEARKEKAVLPQRLVVGQSVEGRPLECLVFGRGSDVVLILASIHGNEPAGTPLVKALADYLAHNPDLLEGRKVMLMPVANPDGMANGRRHNVHGVDLNRNFPASNFHSGEHFGSSSLSEPESQALHRLLDADRPRRMVSLHQPINYGAPCIDYDGPAKELAEAMAARCDLPLKKLGAQHGSLGSYAGIALGIPIVTVELPKDAGEWSAEELWNRYGAMLLAAVAFPGSGTAR